MSNVYPREPGAGLGVLVVMLGRSLRASLHVGGGGGVFVARHKHLTIDHASLSRRNKFFTPNGDTSKVWALSTFGRYIINLNYNSLLFKSPSCLAVCGHHLSLRIATVFSLLATI